MLGPRAVHPGGRGKWADRGTGRTGDGTVLRPVAPMAGPGPAGAAPVHQRVAPAVRSAGLCRAGPGPGGAPPDQPGPAGARDHRGLTDESPRADTGSLATAEGGGHEGGADDFGTGYSSLGYLRQFPVDTLKVDRSFVAEVHQDAGNQQLVAAIVAMAATLKLHVVAEGVETQSQAALLADMGCDTLQGFLFARPMPAAALAGLLGGRATTETPGAPPDLAAGSAPALQHDLAAGAP